MLRVNEDLRAL